MYLVAGVFASKLVIEPGWKSAEILPLSVKQIELPKCRLPFRFQLTVGRPNFQVKHSYRRADPKRDSGVELIGAS